MKKFKKEHNVDLDTENQIVNQAIDQSVRDLDEADDLEHAVQKSFIAQVPCDPSHDSFLTLDNISLINFGSFRLSRNDIDCIKPRQWLTDDVIGLYLEYLSQNLFSNYQNSFQIILPSVVQLIKHARTEPETNELLLPLNLPSRNLIIIPINNAVGNSSGSHWSVVVISSIDKI